MIERPSSPEAVEDEAEIAEIPLTLVGGQQLKPDDVIRLKVVSVDTENGVINVAYAHDDMKPKGPSNSEAMAEEYNSPESVEE